MPRSTAGTSVAFAACVRSYLHPMLLAFALALCAPSIVAAASDTASAEKNRRKPLQRCDQLKGEAELECLQKARERVVESRKTRETKTAAATEKRETKTTGTAEKRDSRTTESAEKRDPKK